MSEEISREEIAALLARGNEEMTREEAIMVLKNEQPHCGKKALFPEEKKYEAYNVAVKALEQEPCGDAISRQAAIDIIESWLSCDDYNNAEQHIMRATESILYDLPPVTPQPKTGHWEWIQYDGNPNIGNWHCSECSRIVRGAITAANPVYAYKYCPNCGAKMESEEEE